MIQQSDKIDANKCATASWWTLSNSWPGAGSYSNPNGWRVRRPRKCVKVVIEVEPLLNLLVIVEMMSQATILETWFKSQDVPSGGCEGLTIESSVELLPSKLSREFGENVLFAQQFEYDGSDPTIIRSSEVYSLTRGSWSLNQNS